MSETVCTLSESVCTLSESVCTWFGTVCTWSESVCTLSESVCTLSETVCTLFESVCTLSETVCTLFETVCTLFETVCTLFETVCTMFEIVCRFAASVRNAYLCPWLRYNQRYQTYICLFSAISVIRRRFKYCCLSDLVVSQTNIPLFQTVQIVYQWSAGLAASWFWVFPDSGEVAGFSLGGVGLVVIMPFSNNRDSMKNSS